MLTEKYVNHHRFHSVKSHSFDTFSYYSYSAYSYCSEREIIFKMLSFSSIGINVNYLLSELMFNNAELLQAQRPHFNTMEIC